jgi:formylglycine-generating enzyme required for sulfatase activity
MNIKSQKLISWLTVASVALLIVGCVAPVDVITDTPVPTTPPPSETSSPAPTITATPTPTATLIPTDTLTPSPSPTPVLSNAEWTPVIQEFDGVEMALVPAGCFTMGTSNVQIDVICEVVVGRPDCDRSFYQDEQPVTEICFAQPFWIDLYEVTNAQYGSSGQYEGDDIPRDTVTWFEALEHCQSRSGRLPTEAEWEYAARGPDNLIYPWGNTFDGTRLNYCDVRCGSTLLGADMDTDDGYISVAPVGSYPNGVSWIGAYDMAGNVREWTNSIYEEYPYNTSDGRERYEGSESRVYRVLRGGAYTSQYVHTRTSNRLPFVATYNTSHDVGFRCVMDYVPGSD